VPKLTDPLELGIVAAAGAVTAEETTTRAA
jgi:hypothetical protein